MTDEQNALTSQNWVKIPTSHHLKWSDWRLRIKQNRVAACSNKLISKLNTKQQCKKKEK